MKDEKLTLYGRIEKNDTPLFKLHAEENVSLPKRKLSNYESEPFEIDNQIIDEIEKEKAIRNFQKNIQKLQFEDLPYVQTLNDNYKQKKLYNDTKTDISKINVKRNNKTNLYDNQDNSEQQEVTYIYDDMQKLEKRANIFYEDYKTLEKEKRKSMYVPDKNAQTYYFDISKYKKVNRLGNEKNKNNNNSWQNIINTTFNKVKQPIIHAGSQIGIEHINNPLIRLGAKSIMGTEATEQYYMAQADHYLNTKFAKKHLILDNYKDVPSELQPQLKNKIIEQIGEDKLSTTKGIYIDSDSSTAKNLVKTLLANNDFNLILAKNKDKLKRNIHINSSMEFTDLNFNNAIHYADIIDLHYNKNGELECLIADTYDFNKKSLSEKVKQARKLQEEGKLIPYFSYYHVIFPKEALIQ